MNRLAGVAGVVMLVGVLILAADAQSVGQAMGIQPGRAIGPFEIGMPLERAHALMAQFGAVDPVESATMRGFCNPEEGAGVCVFDRWQRLGLETTGTVVFIITDDARFTTESGGHAVGQPLLDFLRTYGLYSGGRGTEIRWDGRGLSVDITPGDRGILVRLIGVFTPRTVAARVPATP